MLVLAGCGSGERQDANESAGNYKVEVTRLSFPKQQRLAQVSELVVGVRNAGDQTIPNVAVTVHGFNYRKQAEGTQLSDPSRPQFAVNGVNTEIGGFPEVKDATPKGCDTAYLDTWACGPLKPGREKTFRWSVTAVKAGPFKLTWRVSGGLDGKARAISVSGGEAVGGTVTGNVSAKPPQVKIGADGKTVVEAEPR
ncbi:MAG TPA: hypothetical protein VI111_11435 [Thermoleophilaceae bacterium]